MRAKPCMQSDLRHRPRVRSRAMPFFFFVCVCVCVYRLCTREPCSFFPYTFCVPASLALVSSAVFSVSLPLSPCPCASFSFTFSVFSFRFYVVVCLCSAQAVKELMILGLISFVLFLCKDQKLIDIDNPVVVNTFDVREEGQDQTALEHLPR